MGKARRGSRGGKRNRRKGGAAVAVAEAGGKVESDVRNLSGWDAARRSERRGSVVWPSLDSSKELSPHERRETMRKVRAGEANIGFVKRCVAGVSRLIGNLKPQAATPDAEWNRQAEEAFWRRAEHPNAFDMAGKVNFLKWQDCVKRAKIRDGDALTVLASSADGGGRIIFYGAHQVGDGKEPRDQLPSNLYDGVYVDKWGGRAGWRVIDGKGDMVARVDRQDGIYHCDIDQVGRVREVSGMAHAVSNFIDSVEILADTKHAVKIAGLWGVALESALQADGGAEVEAQVKAYLDMDDELSAGGACSDQPGEILTVEQIVQGGRIHGLSPGQKLTTLQDTRPHPNQIALLSWLVRDMAWGVGVSPEVLWDTTSMNGTAMRYVMAETRRFIEDSQKTLEQDCKRVWMYFLAKEMKAGRLERPPEDLRWWQSVWIPQADMTIDRAREGALELQQVEAGLKTRAQVWGERGLDWEEQERQMLHEEQRRAELREEILTAGSPPAES